MARRHVDRVVPEGSVTASLKQENVECSFAEAFTSSRSSPLHVYRGGLLSRLRAFKKPKKTAGANPVHLPPAEVVSPLPASLPPAEHLPPPTGLPPEPQTQYSNTRVDKNSKFFKQMAARMFALIGAANLESISHTYKHYPYTNVEVLSNVM